MTTVAALIHARVVVDHTLPHNCEYP